MKIELIRIDGGTQSRAEINEQAVAEYAEALLAGAEFPPVTIYHDGAEYWLADGFHRYHAARRAGLIEIKVTIINGTLRDAVLFSMTCNIPHGLRRSSADKRKSVNQMLADPEWATWPLREIAEFLQVGKDLVASCLRKLEKGKESNRCSGNLKPSMSSGGKDNLKTSHEEPAASPCIEREPENNYHEPPSASEMADAHAGQAEIAEYVADLMAAGGEVADALGEVAKLRGMLKLAQARIDGLMNEKNELIRTVKGLQARCKILEKKA